MLAVWSRPGGAHRHGRVATRWARRRAVAAVRGLQLPGHRRGRTVATPGHVTGPERPRW